jgi:hypothetical protein
MERAGASDPAIAEFMGPLRTAALQRWDTETRPHTAALLRASAVEEAWLRGNRQLLTTCANDTRSAFNAYVRSRNPHSEADVRAAVAAPAGHLWRRPGGAASTTRDTSAWRTPWRTCWPSTRAPGGV